MEAQLVIRGMESMFL